MRRCICAVRAGWGPKRQPRSWPRPRLRFAGLLLKSAARGRCGQDSGKQTTPLVAATRAPFCGLLLGWTRTYQLLVYPMLAVVYQGAETILLYVS
jgi:hypothetical protein